MKFVMMRDRTVTSSLGHAIEFKRGVPTHVPPALYKEVLAQGGVSEDELPEEDTGKKTIEPTDPGERSELIREAIKIIVERARREDFGATGAPQVKVLATELGWPVNAQERDIAWAEHQAAD